MATVTRQASALAARMKLTPPPPAPSPMIVQMQRKMQRMVPALMMLGFLVIVAGLLVGLVNAATVNDVFERPAQERAAAQPGTELFEDMKNAQVTAAWLPSFMFLGMGLILFSIAVTLMGILGGLRTMGENMYNALSATLRTE